MWLDLFVSELIIELKRVIFGNFVLSSKDFLINVDLLKFFVFHLKLVLVLCDFDYFGLNYS